MEFIDLSVPIETTLSEPDPVRITFIGHEEGIPLLTGNQLTEKDFPEGMGVSLEKIRLNSHSGTHVDAPAHYGPICEGTKARTIDQMPLNWFYSRGILIDVEQDSNDPVTKLEVQESLKKNSERIREGDIVLIKTGADKLWGNPEYFTDFRGMTLESVDWILDQGVKVIGIDSFGFDAPFHKMIDNYSKSGDQANLWPAHFLGRKREYCQIERLANLDKIPINKNLKVSCFPVKIKGAGAGWSRVVAIIED